MPYPMSFMPGGFAGLAVGGVELGVPMSGLAMQGMGSAQGAMGPFVYPMGMLGGLPPWGFDARAGPGAFPAPFPGIYSGSMIPGIPPAMDELSFLRAEEALIRRRIQDLEARPPAAPAPTLANQFYPAVRPRFPVRAPMVQGDVRKRKAQGRARADKRRQDSESEEDSGDSEPAPEKRPRDDPTATSDDDDGPTINIRPRVPAEHHFNKNLHEQFYAGRRKDFVLSKDQLVMSSDGPDLGVLTGQSRDVGAGPRKEKWEVEWMSGGRKPSWVSHSCLIVVLLK